MQIVTVIRFLFYFRIFLPKEELIGIVKLLCAIKTGNSSLKQVLLLSINGFLGIRHGDFVMYKNLVSFFNSNNLEDIAVGVFLVIYNSTTEQQFLD